MKTAMLYGIKDLRVVQAEQPCPGDDDILVKIRACAVCPTDIRKYLTGNHSKLHYPVNVGHEWAGDVVEVGSRVQDFSVGMRVAGTARGGYAEYLRYEVASSGPHAIVGVPGNVSYEQATFVEPLADCLHSLRDQGRVTAGDVVVILGAGQMALLHVMVAKSMRAKVIVSEPIASRRDWAIQMGADAVLDPQEDDVVRQVRQLTAGTGADAIVVSVGMPALVTQALQMAAPRGRVVLFGGFPGEASVTFDPNLLHYNEICLTGSEWVGVAGHEDFDLYGQAMLLIGEGRIPVQSLITSRFPLDEIEQAFDVVGMKTGLKAIILPHPGDPSL